MAYIQPNTTVKILRNVPLDKGYNHTLLQKSINEQYEMFTDPENNFVKYTIDNQSYQRSGNNKIRVRLGINSIIECNYLMFKNTNYENKWFYAFINNFEYINNATTEITYTIDVMQTWYFDYAMEYCFIDREHTLTDTVGENLIPEDFNVGNLIPSQKWEFTYPDSIDNRAFMYKLVVIYVPNNEKKYVSGQWWDDFNHVTKYYLSWCNPNGLGNYNTSSIVNNIYLGAKYWGVDMLVDTPEHTEQTRKDIDSLINTIISDDVEGTIVNIMQVPWFIWNDCTTNEGQTVPRGQSKTETRNFYSADGRHSYVCKNNKMLTYPYRRIIASNNAGGTAEYKWEYFITRSGNIITANFAFAGVPIIMPEVMCYPLNYRNIINDYESGLVLNDFPSPPWSEDSFAKWWAQNKEAYITSLISTAILSGTSIMGTAYTGQMSVALSNSVSSAARAAATATNRIGIGAIQAGTSVAQSLGTLAVAQNTPDQFFGQTNISSLRTIQRRIGFYFYDMGVEASVAKTIDDYFSMFGYAIKALKIPNVKDPNVSYNSLRPYWNYIKTSTCIIHPINTLKGLPADVEEEITEIYNNGITFWKNPSQVGNYSLDNSPV